jgi:hypothetical protein
MGALFQDRLADWPLVAIEDWLTEPVSAQIADNERSL